MNRKKLASRLMIAARVAVAAAGCDRADPPAAPPAEPAVASRERAVAFCAACHAFPPPDCFPKANWDGEVRRGFDFYRKSDLKLDPPSIASVVAFYESEAPAAFPLIPRTRDRDRAARSASSVGRSPVPTPTSPRRSRSSAWRTSATPGGPTCSPAT